MCSVLSCAGQCCTFPSGIYRGRECATKQYRSFCTCIVKTPSYLNKLYYTYCSSDILHSSCRHWLYTEPASSLSPSDLLELQTTEKSFFFLCRQRMSAEFYTHTQGGGSFNLRTNIPLHWRVVSNHLGLSSKLWWLLGIVAGIIC